MPFFTALVAGLVFLAQSRTALLVFGFQFLLLVWFHIRHRVDLIVHATAIVILGVLLMASEGRVYQLVEHKVSNMIEYGSAEPTEDGLDENVSNVTRLASINAAFSMFWERPFFGVGFGQFGFNYPQHISADDLRSWEVRDYIQPSDAKGWPPSYSLHARMLAETGIAGYSIWMGLILLFLLRSLKLSVVADRSTAHVHVAVAMILSGWLLLGMSIDSFRFFGGWIALGVALATGHTLAIFKAERGQGQ
jgi:O-antigen ligase